MKQYRGYYIDHIYFNDKSEIDDFIKKQAVERFAMLNKMFLQHPSMELSVMCSEQADRLHNLFGFSYEELEELEISAYTA
ncbi:hypothetical protein [Enterocloster bolteae]|uniref:hypothetical protein n=1 Tax=Enterocloster bolteae TaxID=208479 RepID=UPI002A82D762|nr:hypothetical protein [Enterocloster bolteae]